MGEVAWVPEESQEACRAHCGEGEASEPQHDLHAIANVLEELLSLESLCRRSELFSQITSQLYVPIAVLMNCAELRELASGDRGAVVEAAKTSQKVLLDPSGTMLKPNVAVRRNTLVLRDIETGDPAPADEEAAAAEETARKASSQATSAARQPDGALGAAACEPTRKVELPQGPLSWAARVKQSPGPSCSKAAASKVRPPPPAAGASAPNGVTMSAALAHLAPRTLETLPPDISEATTAERWAQNGLNSRQSASSDDDDDASFKSLPYVSAEEDP